MLPVNVVLSVFSEVSPYFIEADKTTHYPDSIDARKLLQSRKAGLRDFLLNWLTERLIGTLKGVIQNKILDSPSLPNKTEMRIRAFLGNME